jgi:hypothetical protein
MTAKAMPNVLRNQAVPNLLSGVPVPPLPARPRLPRGFAIVALAGGVAVLVAIFGGGG